MNSSTCSLPEKVDVQHQEEVDLVYKCFFLSQEKCAFTKYWVRSTKEMVEIMYIKKKNTGRKIWAIRKAGRQTLDLVLQSMLGIKYVEGDK